MTVKVKTDGLNARRAVMTRLEEYIQRHVHELKKFAKIPPLLRSLCFGGFTGYLLTLVSCCTSTDLWPAESRQAGCRLVSLTNAIHNINILDTAVGLHSSS